VIAERRSYFPLCTRAPRPDPERCTSDYTECVQSLRAIALVTDVRLAESDAVRVELEHREGRALAVFLPYRKKRVRRGIEYGNLSAGPGTQQVWSP